MPFSEIHPNDELPHEVTTGTRRAYDSRYLHVRVDSVRLPSGRDGERVVVERIPSVVIVPVTTEGNVLLIPNPGRHLWDTGGTTRRRSCHAPLPVAGPASAR